ncbi:hypothetical protein NXC14_CH01977 [Rhizobium sp. NXC14]|uniref:hypothetical protein n=1 Tax=Rhizobium sp. NXC14 TaxID=1981173 RepID=UPI000A207706|nr:hypothetical protein [Rhizobium sp. NXC14]ARO29927.1 hypothetical protein NXC14_CH01977 [Rhizobium sp. NXC14]
MSRAMHEFLSGFFAMAVVLSLFLFMIVTAILAFKALGPLVGAVVVIFWASVISGLRDALK